MPTRSIILAIAGSSMVFSHAAAAQDVVYLPVFYVGTNLSADGSVVVGNQVGSYETFRWTASSGPVLLGEATAPVLGVGAGGPDVSHDGTRVSATILTEDATLATPGFWTQGLGWTRCMPPMAPDGRILDQAIGSAWGISGDGTTVSGLHWYSMPDGSYGGARPFTWSASSGLIQLDITAGQDGRANTTNLDGSVAVGWESNAFGHWQPVVWRNGTRMQLSENDAFVGCEEVTSDGNTVVGQSWYEPTLNRVATVWAWNGSSYDQNQLGVLPGTPVDFGSSVAFGVSDDGSMIVGVNRFAVSPGGPSKGFIWTAETGMVEAEAYLADLGIDVSDEMDLRSVDGISADGSTILISGWDSATQIIKSAIVTLTTPCVADTNGDGQLTPADFTAWINAFNNALPECDQNADGACTPTDFTAWINNYNAGCD